MTAAADRTVPPIDQVVVGQVVPRLPRPEWAGWAVPAAFVLASVAVAFVVGVSVVDPASAAERVPALIGAVLLLAMLGSQCLAWTRSELVVRIGRAGVDVAAGGSGYHLPWGSVRRCWVAGSGSVCPVLCLLVEDGYLATGRWRVKAYTAGRLFGTPVAVPMACTGLSEQAVVAMVGSYLDNPVPASPAATSTGVRFRGLLAAGIAAGAVVVVALVWAAAAAHMRAVPVVDVVDLVQVAAVGALAGAATVAVVGFGAAIYRAVVPGRWLCGHEPVLRVGPEGVEHAVLGRVRRLPWSQVRHAYVAGGTTAPVAIVVTGDPLALVPRSVGWSLRVRRQQRRYGAPVAVPLSGSGLTVPDLLKAIHHYAGTVVATHPDYPPTDPPASQPA